MGGGGGGSSSSAGARVVYGPSSWGTYSSTGKRSESGFVGLSNQGATCYMNSLLQTLYMTPEFRSALYKLDFDRDSDADGGGDGAFGKASAVPAPAAGAAAAAGAPAAAAASPAAPEKDTKAIPRELQRLFARLQLCDVRAVKTKELTKSFGWKDADAFTQHDVQELCRVLFDALERVLRGSGKGMDNLINDLYQGEMKDYVQCKECGHESSRTDKYLDIPLVIKPFGEQHAVRSVQEALNKFVQPELLEGENQYLCTRCNKKVDARKGLKLLSCPYLLMLQLKRFDFDYDTMQRVKLNDRVEFPLTLDMHPFLDDSLRTSQTEAAMANIALSDNKMAVDPAAAAAAAGAAAAEGRKRKKSDEADTPAGAGAAAAAAAAAGEPSAAGAAGADDMTIGNTKGKGPSQGQGLLDTPRTAGLAGKPHVYELYSILIHRGSSMAGHYYAYIRSFETNRWYEFNDSTVSEISMAEIEKAYGDDERSSYWARGANAYMLMYRLVDPARNKNLVPPMEISERLRHLIEKENDQSKAKEEAKDKEREQIKVKLVYNLTEEKTLSLNRTMLLADVKLAALQAFGLQAQVEPACARLRKWEGTVEVPAQVYRDDITLDQTDSYYKEFYLETKPSADTPWPVLADTDYTLKVVQYDVPSSGWRPAVLMSVSYESTLQALKERFAEAFGIPVEKQMVVRELPFSSQHLGRILWDNPKPLSSMHVGMGSRIYVEYSENPNDDSAPPRSKDEIERRRNMLDIHFNALDSRDLTLRLTVDKRMTLPDLKRLMEPMLGVPADQFRVLRGHDSWATELKSDTDTLDAMNVMDGGRLTVERGRPSRPNEVKISVFLYQPLLPLDMPPPADQKEDRLEPLFDMAVDETLSISALKALLAAEIKAQKQLELHATHMRIREYSSMHRMPLKAYPDTFTLKECFTATYCYSQRGIVVQPLNASDTVTSLSDICLNLLQWQPSKYAFGPRGEIAISASTTVADLKQQLRTRFGVANPGVCSRTQYTPPEPIDMPEMEFDRMAPADEPHLPLSRAPWYVRDSEFVVWRDNDEPLKELSAEEKTKIKRAAAAARTRTYGKEKALHIDA